MAKVKRIIIQEDCYQVDRYKFSPIFGRFIRAMIRNGNVRDGLDVQGMISLAQRLEKDDGSVKWFKDFTKQEGAWIRNLADVIDEIAFKMVTEDIPLKRDWFLRRPYIEAGQRSHRRFMKIYTNKVPYLEQLRDKTKLYKWHRPVRVLTRIELTLAVMQAYIEGAVR